MAFLAGGSAVIQHANPPTGRPVPLVSRMDNSVVPILWYSTHKILLRTGSYKPPNALPLQPSLSPATQDLKLLVE